MFALQLVARAGGPWVPALVHLLPGLQQHRPTPSSSLCSCNTFNSFWICKSSSSISSSSVACSTASLTPHTSSSWSDSGASVATAQGQQQLEQQAVFVLPMPSLSHAMTSGRINKWLKSPGDFVSIYDILAEVTTDSLVDEAYKVDDFAGSVTLLLESQEEAYLAAVLVPEGQEVHIGTPVAVLCEVQHDVPAVAAAAAEQLHGLNVYDESALQRQQQLQGGLKLQLLEWQSYLKESTKESSDGSCGCM